MTLPKWFLLGALVAGHDFKMFSTKENRGVNFRWQKFPAMAANMASVEYPISMNSTNRVSAWLCGLTAWIFAWGLSAYDRSEEKKLDKLP